jgi:chemotaxis methyl-accepting protein methylase
MEATIMKLSPPMFSGYSGEHFSDAVDKDGKPYSDAVDKNGKPSKQVCDYTHLFRDKKLFDRLPELVKKRFPKGVPIYSYGASDGSEPYSIVIKLLESLGQAADVYLPVHARDISKEMVERGTAGKIHLSWKDFAGYFFSKVKSPMKRYFQRIGTLNYQVQPELKTRVDYQWGDIVEDTQKPFSSPCILFFRNAFYLIKDQLKLARNLYKNLQPGSLVVLGNASDDLPTPNLLKQVGFRPLSNNERNPLSHVFERPI